MTTFAYRGFDSSGKSRRGLAEAVDVKQVREKLAEAGILAESVAPANRSGPHRRKWFRSEFSMVERAGFYEEFCALLRAGMPMVKALDLLIQSSENRNISFTLASIRDRIKEGASLADAMQDASVHVSSYELGVISAGERAGVLDTALKRLGEFLDEQKRLRDSVVTALIYPAIVVVVAIGIAVGLLGFAVPRIGQLLQDEAGIALPALTRFMIWLGTITATWGLPLLILAAGLVVLAAGRMKRDPALLTRLNRLMFRLPIVGHGYSLLINLRFARTLSLLLTGDVPLVEAMKLAGEATGSSWIAGAIAKETEQVRHGSTLADALRRTQPFDEYLARWAQVGEAGGQLPQLLDGAATRFQQQWDRFISRLMSVLEPALIVIISVFVLLVVLSILLPVLSLNQSLLG